MVLILFDLILLVKVQTKAGPTSSSNRDSPSQGLYGQRLDLDRERRRKKKTGMQDTSQERGRKTITKQSFRSLNGGNGNPTSGYEANERCAADHHDHATRPAAHRVDHTSISTQSMFACIDQHVDQSMFHCLLCLNQCALACASTASMFASNQTACQRKKTSPVENLCSSPVKPTTTPPHSPCPSTSKLLEDHKCFFSQALRSRRSWWRRDLFQ